MVSNNRKARPRTSGSILAGLMRPITQPLQARLLVRANTAYLCSATLNSLINGVSRISRNNCQASAGDEKPRITRRNTPLKWGGRGSNPRPRDYESPALTN
ncbi:MAG: hypothetical protein QOK02_2855 [Mycobacterium sp.]|nr:hypothetical protein [Mycobacterium sp.]